MKMPVLFWIGMGRVVFQFIPYKVLFSERQERKFWIRGKICGKKERERENKEKTHLGNTVTLLTTRIDIFIVCYLLAFCFLTLETL